MDGFTFKLLAGEMGRNPHFHLVAAFLEYKSRTFSLNSHKRRMLSTHVVIISVVALLASLASWQQEAPREEISVTMTPLDVLLAHVLS
jgi:hypothetical protein